MQVFSVAISPDGKTLASSSDQTIKLWDLATGGLKLTLLQSGVGHVAFSPDGRTMAAVEHKTIKLWEVATGKLQQSLAGHSADIRHVAFSPNGKLLASTSNDGTVRLWDPGTGKMQRLLGKHVGTAGCTAFSPDGKTLASGGWEDTSVRLWQVETGWEPGALSIPPSARVLGVANWVRGVAFHPDGRTLAACSNDQKTRLWDLAHGLTADVTPQVLEGHEHIVVDIAWRTDGRLLASCGAVDCTLRLWDITVTPPRCQVLKLFPNRPYLHGIAFTPEGRYLATANPDGTVYVLRLAERGVVADNAHFQRREIAQYQAWAKAIAGQKTTQHKAAPAGRMVEEPFDDVPKQRSLLVGFTVQAAWTGQIVGSVQPIYLTPEGIKNGSTFSSASNNPAGFITALAKPGYAVGGIVVKHGDYVNGFQVIFMRIDGGRLNPEDRYQSETLGGRGGGTEVTVGGDGRPVVGIHGTSAGGLVSLGLVQLDTEEK